MIGMITPLKNTRRKLMPKLLQTYAVFYLNLIRYESNVVHSIITAWGPFYKLHLTDTIGASFLS